LKARKGGRIPSRSRLGTGLVEPLRTLHLVAPAGGIAIVEMFVADANSWVRWSSGTITDLDTRFFERDPSREMINQAARDHYAFETCLDIDRLEYLLRLALTVTRERGYSFVTVRDDDDSPECGPDYDSNSGWHGLIDVAPPDLVMTCFGIVAVEYSKALTRMQQLPAEWTPFWGGIQ
jgi:hypothetical protein